MALLKGLFGRREPAPELPIHPEDGDLVSEADRSWWRTLTLKDCQLMERQDNITKVTALTHYMEDDSLSEEEAVQRVRRSFPAYYGSLASRADEPLGFAGEDAKLPYVLKDRFNRALTGKMRKLVGSELQSASSINALIRSLIRERRI